MAFPTVQERLTESHTGGDATISVSMPASVNSGELLIIFLGAYPETNSVSTDPSGWTKGWELEEGVVYYKTSDGTEEGTTVDIVFSGNVNGFSIVHRISGWSGVAFGTAVSGTSNSPNPPSLTTTSGDNLWIAHAMAVDDEHTWNSAPTNYSNLTSGNSQRGENNSAGVATAERELNTDTEDPASFTLSESESWNANIMVVQPEVSTFTLTITSANGTVTKDPDKAEYDPSEVVELTADPDAGYKFDSWSGDITSTDNPVNVTMDADKSITANYTEVDIINPEDGETGVSLTPLLDWKPDLTFSGFDKYLVIVADNTNFDTPYIIERVVDIDEYQVLAGVFANSTNYHMKVWGLRVNLDTTVYNEDFAGISDQSGWTDDWTTVDQTQNGNLSFDITSERARIVSTGGAFVATADLNGIDIADTTQEFLVRSSLISNNVQPSYYFRASGDWSAGNKKQGYQFWFWDQKVHLVKTDSELNNSILAEVATALSADTDYMIKYNLVGSLIQWKIWEVGQGEPADWTEYNDDNNPILTGRHAIKIATGASAGSLVMEFDDFNIVQSEEVPVITSIDAGDTEYTVNHTEVANATGYEYREDGGTAQTANSTDGSFTVTGRTNGQTYAVEMRAIVSGSPTSWSNSVDVTPEEDSIVSVTIDQADANVEVGQTKQLTVTVETTGSPDTSVTWASSDEAIATVDSNGIVEGVSEGSCLITATSVADNSESDSVSSDVSEATEPAEWFSDATIRDADSIEEDKNALAQFFADTNGPTDWTNTTGWSTNPANIDLTAGNEPFGVTAVNERVTVIRLNNDGTGDPQNVESDCKGNGLTGTLTNDLGKLKKLTLFNVERNSITGSLPGGLRYLGPTYGGSLQRVYLNGSPNRAGLTDWAEVDEASSLSGNRGKWGSFDNYPNNNFSGRLPGEWSDWGSSVIVLQLANTIIDASTGDGTILGIDGELPSYWGDWDGIKHLMLMHNKIQGKLPPEWASMVELKDLFLDNNQLGDPNGGPDADLPSEWGGGTSFGDGMRKLRHLSLNYTLSGGSSSQYFGGEWRNSFNGSDGQALPENWGNMKMLHRLGYPRFNEQVASPAFLSSGDFHNRTVVSDPDPDADPVEAFASGLTEITDINNVTTFPTPSNLSYLSRWNGFNNPMSGLSLPSDLGQWNRMLQFDVGSCGLVGTFPDIDNWNNFGTKILNAQGNNFDNGLPELNVDNHQQRNMQWQNSGFTGQIPSSWNYPGSNKFFRLWIDRNFLSGPIPAKLAECDPDDPEGNFHSYSSEFRLHTNRFNFADLVPFLNDVLSTAGTLSQIIYAPQRKLGSSQTYNRSVGESLNVDPFSSNFTHANNSYQWYKDGSAVSGETSRALSLSNLQVSDAGTYHLEVTNSSAPDLTLQSRDVTLNVS